MFCHGEHVEGGPAQKDDERDLENTEVLHSSPRTPQSLAPDTYKSPLPWGSCTTPVPSPQIPCIAYTSLSQFLLLTTKRTST